MALFTLTGNGQALELPNFIDRKNYVMVGPVPLSRCISYGEIVNSDYPGSLDRSSIDCVTDWGHTEEHLIRLLSGNMGSEEFDAALANCLTADEYSVVRAPVIN